MKSHLCFNKKSISFFQYLLSRQLWLKLIHLKYLKKYLEIKKKIKTTKHFHRFIIDYSILHQEIFEKPIKQF